LVVGCGESLWVGLFLLPAWQVLFPTSNIYLKSLEIAQVVHDSQPTSLPFNQLPRSQINHSYISLLLASKPPAYSPINIYFRIPVQSFLRFLAPLGKICGPMRNCTSAKRETCFKAQMQDLVGEKRKNYR